MSHTDELLKFALENGIIDLGTIQEKMEMNERKKYLNMHPYSVWEGKNEKWYTYLPDGENGKKLKKLSSKKAIEDAIVSYYKEAEHEPTVKNVFYEWVERKLKYGEIQKQTYDRYLNDFEKYFLLKQFVKTKIRYVTENQLEDFIMETIVDNNLTAKAWGNIRIIIRGMFVYAKKRKYTQLNITMFFAELDISKKVFSKSKRKDELNVFTEDELKMIIAKLWERNTIGHLGVLMAIYTGMRVGEISALKWEDVKDDYIHINRSQIKFKDENGKTKYDIRNSPKTDTGIRDVVIIPELRMVLKRIRLINPFTEYVFEKNGNFMSVHAFTMILYRVCEELNIQKRGMHVLRKTYATRLINAGIDESIIINQMGHTDFKTTKNYYYYNNKSGGHMSDMISSALAL